jgi:hypothetical protein
MARKQREMAERALSSGGDDDDSKKVSSGEQKPAGRTTAGRGGEEQLEAATLSDQHFSGPFPDDDSPQPRDSLVKSREKPPSKLPSHGEEAKSLRRSCQAEEGAGGAREEGRMTQLRPGPDQSEQEDRQREEELPVPRAGASPKPGRRRGGAEQSRSSGVGKSSPTRAERETQRRREGSSPPRRSTDSAAKGAASQSGSGRGGAQGKVGWRGDMVTRSDRSSPARGSRGRRVQEASSTGVKKEHRRRCEGSCLTAGEKRTRRRREGIPAYRGRHQGAAGRPPEESELEASDQPHPFLCTAPPLF